MIFAEAARPARQSFALTAPSTVDCDAVAACTYERIANAFQCADENQLLPLHLWLKRLTVVIMPCLMPHFSWMSLTSGASPFVVQDAQETTCMVS
mmetsp:Transcript_18675/g.40246  ORF Transcript_18675/g.40246 Transcript_18675/m.40246 type:complete len:95 (+) Transcript_18675:768-1052(+)